MKSIVWEASFIVALLLPALTAACASSNQRPQAVAPSPTPIVTPSPADKTVKLSSVLNPALEVPLPESAQLVKTGSSTNALGLAGGTYYEYKVRNRLTKCSLSTSSGCHLPVGRSCQCVICANAATRLVVLS